VKGGKGRLKLKGEVLLRRGYSVDAVKGGRAFSLKKIISERGVIPGTSSVGEKDLPAKKKNAYAKKPNSAGGVPVYTGKLPGQAEKTRILADALLRRKQGTQLERGSLSLQGSLAGSGKSTRHRFGKKAPQLAKSGREKCKVWDHY